MLRNLRVRNLALIEEAELDLRPGMITLTGETGAGKSLLMDSLGLLAGSRATPSLVRSGEERATVEALFDFSTSGPLNALLDELGLESDQPGEILLRRELLAGGRSRAAINGRMVPLAQLQQVASHLMEIGGQHDQVALLDPARQRELYDTFAGATRLAADVRALWRERAEIARELGTLETNSELQDQKRELLRFQLAELEGAAIEAGELERLQEERTRLGNRENLITLAGLASACLCDAAPGESSALDLAGRALASLEDAESLDPSLSSLREELSTAHSILSDIGMALNKYVSRSEADPERIAELDERIQIIRRILKRHGPTEQDALTAMDAIRCALEGDEHRDERREELRAALETHTARFRALVADLSAVRNRAADSFAKPLIAVLKDFAMPKVRFSVNLATTEPGPDGAETVEFLFSANEGEAPQPLRRVASGGELSRLLLALRTMSTDGQAPLLVFDEVDAGLSGVAARRVGERLSALAQQTQVLCVTHNANVSALADQHILIEKRTSGGRTISSAHLLQGIARERELARLLDGGKQSEKGLALAAELLARSA